MAENFPEVKKETYPGTGSTKCSKKGESKQTHIKAHHGWISNLGLGKDYKSS